MIHVAFYVPLTHAEAVKEAMFKAGGGRIGNYDCCSFETEGSGQFRALSGSNPFIGQQDQIERVKEVKVEMVCAEEVIKDVIAAMKKAHPYETPAYYAIKVLQY